MENPQITELIPVIERDGRQAVNAHDLHERLEVGRDFSTWIKDRIEKYGFVEGEDYRKWENPGSPKFGESSFTTPQKKERRRKARREQSQSGDCSENLIVPKFGDNQVSSHGGRREGAGRPEIDYFFTLGAAKEIIAGENSDRGREIRRYLIRIEEAWNNPYMTARRTVQLGLDPQWFTRELEKALKTPNSEYALEGRKGRMLRIASGLDNYKDKIERETRELKAEIRQLEAYAKENMERMAAAGVSPREWD
jgi:phage anti-repressor protein